MEMHYSETRVSLEDLAQMAFAASITQCQRQLMRSYEWLAKVDSHYQFVTTCLRKQTIPQGLKIKVHPCMPVSPCREPATCLQKEWAPIIKQANCWFLASLRTYHRGCAQHLQLQIANLESSIVTQLGKTNAKTRINPAKYVYDKCNHHLWECQKRNLRNSSPRSWYKNSNVSI